MKYRALPALPCADEEAPPVIEENQVGAMGMVKVQGSPGKDFPDSAEKGKESTQSKSFRQGKYDLDRPKAIEKKIAACDRKNVVTTKHGKENYKIIFSTAAFEAFRVELTGKILLFPKLKNVLSGKEETQACSNRNITYTPTLDNSGAIVSETIQIRNWAAVEESQLCGRCSVTINMYRTTTKVLINGKHAPDFMDIIEPCLSRIDGDQDISHQNHSYKEVLENCQHQINYKGNTKDMKGKTNTKKRNVPALAETAAPEQEEEMEEKVKCIFCKRNTKTRAIWCEVCEQWMHYHCANLTGAEIQAAEEHENSSYTCKGCKTLILHTEDDQPLNQYEGGELEQQNMPQIMPGMMETEHPSNQKPLQLSVSSPVREVIESGMKTAPLKDHQLKYVEEDKTAKCAHERKA